MNSQAKNNVQLFANGDSKQIQFAILKIQTVLNENGQRSSVNAVSQITRLKRKDWPELFRERPCITIPDDHDVGQYNLWGEMVKYRLPGQVTTEVITGITSM